MIEKIKIHNWQSKISVKQEGFTLVELLVAISLFIVVVVISMGAILSVFDANKKAQSSKTVVDNLNIAVENMARTVRFGTNYHCGSDGYLSTPTDCSNGDTSLAVSFEGSTIVYRLNGTAIQISNNGGSTYTNITSPETIIEYLKFYVFGSSDSDANQPYVVVVISGYVGSRSTNQTAFSIETLMSQRILDI